MSLTETSVLILSKASESFAIGVPADFRTTKDPLGFFGF